MEQHKLMSVATPTAQLTELFSPGSVDLASKRSTLTPVHQLSFAMHDRDLCVVPGLFRSIKKGERSVAKLSVRHQYRPDRSIEVSGPEPLGVDDMRVLQGIVSMAGPGGMDLGPNAVTPEGRQLWALLAPHGLADHERCLMVYGTYSELCRAVGYSKNDARQVRASIERLFKVTVIVQSGTTRRGYRLLSSIETNSQGKTMAVALSPGLTAAIVGRIYTRIELSEVRALKSDHARLVHQRLCAFIDPGTSRRVLLSTLAAYILQTPATAGAQRMRLNRARKAIRELQTLPGWTIVEEVEGKFKISRARQVKPKGHGGQIAAYQ